MDTPHGQGRAARGEASAEAPGLPRFSPEIRKAMILAAARECFTEAGFSGTSTKDVAVRAGVSESLIFRHYANKRFLFNQAVLEPLRVSVEGVIEVSRSLRAHDGSKDIDTAFQAEMLAAFSAVAPLLGIALFGDIESGQQNFDAIIRPLFAEMSSALAEVESPIDPRLMTALLNGMYFAYGIASAFGEELPPVEEAARQINHLLRSGMHTP